MAEIDSLINRALEVRRVGVRRASLGKALLLSNVLQASGEPGIPCGCPSLNPVYWYFASPICIGVGLGKVQCLIDWALRALQRLKIAQLAQSRWCICIHYLINDVYPLLRLNAGFTDYQATEKWLP